MERQKYAINGLLIKKVFHILINLTNCQQNALVRRNFTNLFANVTADIFSLQDMVAFVRCLSFTSRVLSVYGNEIVELYHNSDRIQWQAMLYFLAATGVWSRVELRDYI